MRDRPDDKRVVRTIRAIHSAFEEMLCEKDYRRITVTELCERALVNRKTFYRYYEAMDSLLDEFQEDMVSGYLARVEGLRLPEDLDAITHEFFTFALQRGKVFEHLTCDVAHTALQRRMTDLVMSRYAGEASTDAERSLLLAFVTESTLAIYRQWVADGKALPAERAADIATRLVCRGAAGR